MTALSETLRTIFDNYADVIEGGNTYRGSGTAYYGIPGTYANDPDLNAGDSPWTVTGIGATTGFQVEGWRLTAWDLNRWIKSETPPMFAVCTTASNSRNLNAARLITNYSFTSAGIVHNFTTAAFATNVMTGDIFYAREGFKRLPNNLDIEDDGQGLSNSFDRFFQLSALPGERDVYFGNGYHTYRTQMELKLRILKYARAREAINSVMENLMMIRTILTRGYNPNHRPDYVRALIADKGNSPTIVKEDSKKIIAVDKFDMIYSVNADFI